MMRRHRSVLFVIAEDWFFASHFLPVASRIVQRGYDVAVVCRVTDPVLREAIEESGIRLVESGSFRDGAGAVTLGRQVFSLYRLLRQEQPEIVHLISLRMVVIGGVAAVLARVPVRILALTGLGLLGTARSHIARAGFQLVRMVLLHGLSGSRAVFLFENNDDPARLGIEAGRANLVVVGGAGIDPGREVAQPMPDSATLRVAVVARMIFSKGIAIAVEALAQARRAGADVELTLVGSPDTGNPRSLTEPDLQRMGSRPGVRWVGRAEDVGAVWRDHHVACVPSLGGEGLPRALLEAAAAGRPIVTTRTPGCATFVRDGIEGILVPPGDVEALAAAFVRLSRDRALACEMGRAARAHVLEGFTVDDVAHAFIHAYESMTKRGMAAGPGSHRLPPTPQQR